MDAASLRSLVPALSDFLAAFRDHFGRESTFEHCRSYLIGLLSDLSSKSVEPMALAADTPARTLQEFLSQFKLDHEGVWSALRRRVAARPASAAGTSVGVIDACGHPKRGDKTPGVARQYCGQTGKVDNCVVGQHLLYFEGDAPGASPGGNPFSCLLASDLLSNAGAGEALLDILRAAFTRWPVEQWFERAKNEAGFGCFEVRTYQSLIRHWLCSTLAMLFLAEQTQRLRGEKPTDHPGADRSRDQRHGQPALQASLAFA